MTDEPAQLSRLIAEICNAALDRTLWPSALQRTCDFVDGRTLHDMLTWSGWSRATCSRLVNCCPFWMNLQRVF